MRHALIALIGLILFVGCEAGEPCDGACETTDAKYGIAGRTIHAVDQKTWDAFDGRSYTLVRVEFGDTEECDAFDEDCGYSVYCGFVVGGQEYPVYGDFVADEDVLFDDDELTGLDLPIFDDEDFDDWLWETDASDDLLVECFDDD